MTDEATSPFTVTLKGGAGYEAPWIVVRGDSKEGLAALLEDAEALVPLVHKASQAFHGVGRAQQSLGGTFESRAQSGTTQSTSTVTQGADGNAQPLHDGNHTTDEDQWHNVWEYNHPQAPATPRGPAVLKVVKTGGIDGNGYKKWTDPAKSNAWFKERRPKLQGEEWKGSYFND